MSAVLWKSPRRRWKTRDFEPDEKEERKNTEEMSKNDQKEGKIDVNKGVVID